MTTRITKVSTFQYEPSEELITCPDCHGEAAIPGAQPCPTCGRLGRVDPNKIAGMVKEESWTQSLRLDISSSD